MSLLTGIRVMDLSQLLPGPFCTLLLADLGAEVIRVERTGGGDYIREMLPGIFWTANRNKQSITVDLKSPEGREVCLRLARRSDVVVEGFRPGVTARLGLDYESLRRERPDLIYCSLSGYGQTGPYRDLPGHDINYAATAGALSVPGDIEYPPVRPGIPIGDLSSGMYAALSIVAALYHRAQTGEGQYIDVAITDSVLAWTSVRMGEFLRDGVLLRPEEMPHLSPVNKVFECADGRRIAIGALEDKFWVNLCRALGREDLATNPRYATNRLRNEHRDEILPVIREAFRSRRRDEWVEHLSRYDVPCSPVLEPDEVVAHPQIQARGLVVPVPKPEGGQGLQIRYPVQFSQAEAGVRTPPPAAGQDTDRVLSWLGYSETEIAALRQRGVVG
ncbi:MAG: CoA transferase [Clostridia bacterium]|nr:CoA transferase [Clostridia bacterium]